MVYDSEDLAPRDPKYHDEIGGDRMGFLNFEYIWTFHPEMGIALVPFFDIGYNIDSKQTSDPFSDLKKSVGLELRWRSHGRPALRLRLPAGQERQG